MEKIEYTGVLPSENENLDDLDPSSFAEVKPIKHADIREKSDSGQ